MLRKERERERNKCRRSKRYVETRGTARIERKREKKRRNKIEEGNVKAQMALYQTGEDNIKKQTKTYRLAFDTEELMCIPRLCTYWTFVD